MIAAEDPALAVGMLADAVDACFPAGDSARMLAAAERAMELLRPSADPRSSFLATSHTAWRSCSPAGEPTARMTSGESVAIAEAHARLREDPETAALLAMGPLYLRESDVGQPPGRQRSRSRPRPRRDRCAAASPAPSRPRDAGSDRWSAAQAHYTEALALARETRQDTEIAGALSGLGRLQARLGQEARCRATAEESLKLCVELGLATYEVWTHAALGELELGLGNASAAAEHFERQLARLADAGLADVDLSPAPELVECRLRLGDLQQATQLAAEYLAAAEAKGQPWALARAYRSMALVAADGDAEAHFERALELQAATPDVFETARTRLAFGAYLRRARERARARPELRAAIETFDDLGAEPWAALAGTELAATGETARRRSPHTLDELTPQELQISLILAGGKTTREAAAALFLSPKTVEYHLRHVYRKLDIRSREELAEAMRRR